MAERTIFLKNTGKIPVEITMQHDVVCSCRQKCTCLTKMVPGKNKAMPKRMAKSLKILPGETSEELPAAVLHLPHVKSLLKKQPALLEVLDAVSLVEVI